MSPAPWKSGWDPEDAGPVVSHKITGVQVQVGSFFRSDQATISHNTFAGINAFRNATLKVFGDPAGTGVSSNGYGVALDTGATLQIGIPITDNVYDGIYIGALSSAQRAFGVSFSGNGGLDVNCDHPTAVDVNFEICP
jgi:hypothetical protein